VTAAEEGNTKTGMKNVLSKADALALSIAYPS
jgi:hypothetical protein